MEKNGKNYQERKKNKSTTILGNFNTSLSVIVSNTHTDTHHKGNENLNTKNKFGLTVQILEKTDFSRLVTHSTELSQINYGKIVIHVREKTLDPYTSRHTQKINPGRLTTQI